MRLLALSPPTSHWTTSLPTTMASSTTRSSTPSNWSVSWWFNPAGRQKKTVGLDLNSDCFTGRCYKVAMEALTCVARAVVDDQRLVNWQRLVKSPAELTEIRAAASITDQAMLAAAQAAALPGARSCDIGAASLAASVRGTNGFGGTYTALPPMIGVGTDSDAGHNGCSDRPLRQAFAGDARGGAVVVELGSARHHYHCPMARTMFIGDPSAEYLAFTDVCRRGIQAALAIAVAGRSCHELYWAFQNTLLAEGFSKASRLGYSFGIGFTPDWGEKTCSVRDGDHTILVPGMCLHLIAGCGDGWAYETSEAIVIADHGQPPELLHGVRRDLFVVNCDGTVTL